MTSLFHNIVTSLLHHHWVIIASLFPIAETGNNEPIVAYSAFSMFSLLLCYYQLLQWLPIIICYQPGMWFSHPFS